MTHTGIIYGERMLLAAMVKEAHHDVRAVRRGVRPYRLTLQEGETARAFFTREHLRRFLAAVPLDVSDVTLMRSLKYDGTNGDL
jgi:hypothetical protein